jgi:hypothetical protein
LSAFRWSGERRRKSVSATNFCKVALREGFLRLTLRKVQNAMRFSRDQSELVKRFALETGRAVRSAQWHRKEQSSEWREFVAARAGVAEKLSRDPVPAVGPVPESNPVNATEPDAPAAKDRAAQTREEEMELMAWVNWRATAQIVQGAIRGRDTNLAAYLKAEGEAQKRFREARRLREQAELNSGRLRPASEFLEIRNTLVTALHNILGNMPMEAGPRCNPFDADFAIQALQEWLQDRFTPALDEVIHAFSKYEISHPQVQQTQQPEQ